MTPPRAAAPTPEVTRRIGLSLGADLCWPIAYREILRRLDLRIPSPDGTLRFQVEDVTIEPFDLQKPVRYDLVIDRLTHWYFPTREWIKKCVVMDDLYVFNNPWSVQSMEKHSTYCAMMRLGLPVPRTWLIPPKSYDPKDDLAVTLRRYARLFDLPEVARDLGYPVFMKPYDGGGWRGVSRIEDDEALQAAYDESGKFVMHLQRGVEAHDRFVRCIGLGPQTRAVLYDPGAPQHDRYTLERGFLGASDAREIRDMTLTINAFFGWDFNSCEALRSGGRWMPIDFANPCPDSQVTSLHYHFPWLIKANIRWSIFCAATRRRMRINLDWQPFFDACRAGMTPEERIRVCGEIAEARLETDRFVDFCETHLGYLDDVADEFFGSEAARDAVHVKVSSLYPDHEIGEFTDLFFNRIQAARREEPPGSVPILAS
ncbi:ATP-grasp domain-containing protein [Candidatus Palauibacter sp.]|uniref:ATP-grasp domain-containing protein n=1 Tax=Candidatus Palauibacter sp. TaxID=3101350 RepID=UPI003CC560A0